VKSKNKNSTAVIESWNLGQKINRDGDETFETKFLQNVRNFLTLNSG